MMKDITNNLFILIDKELEFKNVVIWIIKE